MDSLIAMALRQEKASQPIPTSSYNARIELSSDSAGRCGQGGWMEALPLGGANIGEMLRNVTF